MFQFTAEAKDHGGQLLCCVLEDDDLPRLGAGQMLQVKPRFTPDVPNNIVLVGVYFTRQTQDEFLADLRRAGVLSGIVAVDNRAKPLEFTGAYNQGVAARRTYSALEIADPERLCPHPAGGDDRRHWLMGWAAADQQLANETFKPGGGRG